MNLLQNDLLELLIDFDQICRENGVSYSLHGGTLLGAVREKGFIPWDDDIDITMTRNEYEKLLQNLKARETDYAFIRMPQSIRFALYMLCEFGCAADIGAINVKFVVSYLTQIILA